MALIECPECGKQNIPEKFDSCPACGHSFKEITTNHHFSCSVCKSFDPAYETKNYKKDCI